jgi:hypothetical protein
MASSTRPALVVGYCIAHYQRWAPLTPRYDGYCKQVLAVLPGGDLLGANNYGGSGPGGYYHDLVCYRSLACPPLARSKPGPK